MMKKIFNGKEEESMFIGLVGNIFLTIMNISAGVLTGSLAFIAESINTIGDMVTTVAAYLGIKIRRKGFWWAENIVGLFVGLLLANLAFQVFNNAYNALIGNHFIDMGLWLLIPAIGGIVLNTLMTRRLFNIANKIGSAGLYADAKNQQTDIYGSFGIVVAIIASNLTIPYADFVMSLIIGVLVTRSTIEVLTANVKAIINKNNRNGDE